MCRPKSRRFSSQALGSRQLVPEAIDEFQSNDSIIGPTGEWLESLWIPHWWMSSKEPATSHLGDHLTDRLSGFLSLFSRHLQDVFINRDCVRHDSSMLELKVRWLTSVCLQATDECDLECLS